MKFNVKKKGDTITLKVKMSKKEYNSNEKIAFGRRQAKTYLKEKGYNVTENIKTGLVINHTSNKNSEDEFVFKLTEETTPVKVESTVKVNKDVKVGKNVNKKTTPTNTKTTPTNTTTTVSKKATKTTSKKTTAKTLKKEA